MGLLDAVRDSETLTIFAPKDSVFRHFFDEIGVDDCSDIDEDTLTSVLLYHVVGENLLKADLDDGDEFETLEGSDVHIEVKKSYKYKRGRKYSSSKIYVNDAQVVDANILASNGIIHAIDDVLMMK